MKTWSLSFENCFSVEKKEKVHSDRGTIYWKKESCAANERIIHIHRIQNPIILVTVLSRRKKAVLASCKESRDQFERKNSAMNGPPAKAQWSHNAAGVRISIILSSC